MIVAARKPAAIGLALSLLAFVSPHALAQGGIAGAVARGAGAAAPMSNVALDNLTIALDDDARLTIAHVEATNTNLTKDELAKLFSEKTSKDEITAIVAKMKADKLSVPSAVTSNKGSVVTLRNFQATAISEGKIGETSIAGIDGTLKNDKGEDGTIKSGALSVQGLNLARMIAAVRSGDKTAGSGLQIGRVTWSGFEFSAPDTDTPATATGGNLIHVSLGSLDAQGTYDGELPIKGTGVVKDLVIQPAPASSFGQGLASMGYDKLTIGLTFSGSYDKAAKTYVIDDYTLSALNAGAFTMKAKFGNIDPSVFTATQQAKMTALMNATATSLVVDYKDNGLFDKVVNLLAAQQSKQPADLKQEWTAMVTQFVPLLLSGNPASLKIVEAATKFIAAPKSLTITANAKGQPVKFSDLAAIRDPMAFLSKVDIGATAGQ